MNAIKNPEYYERLKTRRNEVMMTLAHVHKEQRTMEENKDRIDCAAYESRLRLLDNLTCWYVDEIARIDEALIRIAEGTYGICVGCHEPIDARRLETTPVAIFCAPCQAMREELSTA